MSSSYNAMGGAPVSGYPGASPAAAPVPAGPLRAQFLTVFAALVILAIPAIWLFIPNLYVQVTGHQTQGIETIVADCGNDYGSDDTQAAVLFIDDQGQFHEIPSNGTCTNFYHEGASVPVWYLPNSPSSTYMLNGGSLFFYIFLGIWLIAAVSALIFPARTTLALIKASAQAETFAPLLRLALLCLVLLAPLLVVAKFVPPGQPNASVDNYHLGETVSVDGRWAVTVQGERVPAEGTSCMPLKITLRNISSQVLAFDTSQITLYDAQEQHITSTCSGDTTALSSIDNLVPGEATSGTLAYLVATSPSLVYLAFQPDPDNATSVAQSFWKIQVTQSGPQ